MLVVKANYSYLLHVGLRYLLESPRKSEVPKVRGLTTAACVWTAAGLGSAIGCGLWQMGLLGGFLTLITLSGMKRLNRFFRFLIGQNIQPIASQLNDPADDDD